MLDQFNNFVVLLRLTVICHLYLFHFLVLLNPDFNCSKSFVSFCFDNVTTGTYNFVSFNLNVAPDGATIAGSASASTVISAKTQSLMEYLNFSKNCLNVLVE